MITHLLSNGDLGFFKMFIDTGRVQCLLIDGRAHDRFSWLCSRVTSFTNGGRTGFFLMLGFGSMIPWVGGWMNGSRNECQLIEASRLM
jgi:hypothetical protein